MRAKFSSLLVTIFLVGACAHTALAQKSWNQTGGGTFDWTVGGNWTPSGVPAVADDARLTNDLASDQFVNNMGGTSAIATTNTINFLAVSNGLGSAGITVQQAPGVVWRSNFGIQLGKNATLIIVTNALIGTNANLTFDLRAGGSPGTLILSNASATSGFSSFVNALSVGGPTNGISNAGTIQFKPNGGQLVSMNYGQTAAFTNNALGTIVMKGTGTGAFIGNFGSGNRAFINNGSIFASAGTLRIDSRDAFSRGGFQNGSTGFIQVDNGGVLELRRTTNSWQNGPAVTNLGTVFMNGGTVVAFDLDQSGNAIGTNVARVIVNVGTINGNGTFKASLNSLSGSTVTPGSGFGTLNVAGNATFGSNSTFAVDLGLPGQNDLLAVTSNLTINANAILSISGGVAGNIYTAATALAVSGTFGSVTPGYTVTYDPTDITIQFIPEPSTLLLVLVGLAGVVAVRRRS